jgi:hypothetical protein
MYNEALFHDIVISFYFDAEDDINVSMEFQAESDNENSQSSTWIAAINSRINTRNTMVLRYFELMKIIIDVHSKSGFKQLKLEISSSFY